MVILLYTINLLVAGIVAWGFQSVLSTTLGDSLSFERLIKDFDYTVFSDFLAKDAGRVQALISQLGWLLFFYSLVSTMLGGGTIAVLHNGQTKFSLGFFFENCGVYFFRFFRLLLVFAALLAIAGIVTMAGLGFLFGILASNAVSEVWPFTLGVICVLVFLFVVMLVVMMADYAKVATVVHDRTAMVREAGRAISFVFRHFLSTTLLQLSVVVLVLAGIALYLITEHTFGMETPLTILLLFIIQQLSVGLKIYTRVLTYGGELQLLYKFEPKVELPAPAAEQAEPPTAVAAVLPPTQPEIQPVTLKPKKKSPATTKRSPQKRRIQRKRSTKRSK